MPAGLNEIVTILWIENDMSFDCPFCGNHIILLAEVDNETECICGAQYTIEQKVSIQPPNEKKEGVE